MHPARSETLRALALACLFAAASAAHAQSGDPQRGRALYSSTNAAPLSCGQDGSCHGPDPAANQYRLLRGADDSALILRAIGSVRTGMAFLQPHVDERDAVDLAAYLGEVARGRALAGSGGTAAGTADGGTGSTPPGTDGAAAAPTRDGAEALSTASPFNAGYGGCAVGGDAPVDPVLPLLAFAAAIALGARRHRAGGLPPGAGRRAACAAMACVALAAVPAVVGATSAGDPAPDFALPGDDGVTVGLGAGPGRIVWLDFWASWCAPCRQSLPWMARMQQRLGAKGLRVVTVALDTDPEAARRFARREAPGLVVAYDPSGVVARAYAIRAMPTSLLIDTDGRVLAVHGGFRPSDVAALERRIERALDALGDARGAGAPR